MSNTWNRTAHKTYLKKFLSVYRLWKKGLDPASIGEQLRKEGLYSYNTALQDIIFSVRQMIEGVEELEMEIRNAILAEGAVKTGAQVQKALKTANV